MKSALVALVLGSACGSVLGVDVLVLSSGLQAIDDAAKQALQSRGHGVAVGPQFIDFDGSFDLAPYDVVYFQANYNWSSGDMPDAGQQQLVDFVESGGGLVASEWVMYKTDYAGELKILGPALPAVFTYWDHKTPATFTELVGDPTLNKGLPDSFEFPMDDYGGTESVIGVKCGPDPVAYYANANTGGPGVIGWEYGFGRVLYFGTTNGATQLADADFGTLFANAMTWASLGGDGGHPGYSSDCDGNGALDLFDFLCFTNAFNGQQEYANCDGDGAFSLFDFLCFVNKFNAGC